MCCLVIIILLCLNIIISIADVPQIIIDIKKNGTCEIIPPPYLMINEMFEVVANHNYHPCLSGNCTFTNNSNEVFVNGFPRMKNNQSISHSKPATRKMANDWYCQFLVSQQKEALNNLCKSVDNYNYLTVNCSLKVNIRAKAKGVIFMKVNEEMVDITNELNNTDYDAYGSYYFNDGELVKFTCTIQKGLAKITFPNTTDYSPIDMHSRSDDITVYMKLKKEFDGKFIYCTKTSQRIHSVVGVKLVSNFRNGALCGFNVNGLKYYNKLQDSSYVYEYYDDELLNITSFIENFPTSLNVECTGQNVPKQFEELFPNITQKVDLSVILKKEHSGLNITCLMERTSVRKIQWSISLALVFDTTFTYFEPHIGGLSMSKTLAKYQHSTYDNIIVYDYSGETLNLTCHSSSNHTEPHWDYNPQAIGNETIESSINKYQISCGFKLIGSITRGIIRCVVKDDSGGNKIAAVELVRPNTGANPRETDAILSGIEPDLASSQFNNNSVTATTSSPTPNNTRSIIMVGCGLLVLLVVISACVLVAVSIRKRKKHNRPLTDIDYQNLPHHNEGPMAMPSQWDTYAQPADLQEQSPYSVPYVENNLDILYSKPLPKNKRNKNKVDEPSYSVIGNNVGLDEPSYATIGNNIDLDEPSYAAVGNNVVLNEPSYAAIDKKREQAKHNDYANKKEHANDSNPSHSQVLPKTLKHGQKQMIPPQLFKELHNKVLPKREREYTEGNDHVSGNIASHYNNVTGESEDNYTTPDKNKYVNEFDSQRYANANLKEDYTEPAYCEPYLKS